MYLKPVHAAAVALAAVALITAPGCSSSKNPMSPTPTPATCTYVLSSTSAQVAAGGQAITVHVETGASCSWSASSPSGWMTLSAGSGSGPADIIVTVAVNDATAERTSSVTIADKIFAVRQSGRAVPACSYALESGSSTFGADGGKGRLTVQTAAGCAWTAQSLGPWITLRVASGSGPGEIEYDVAPFDGTQQRDTRIVVEQASFTVRQDPPAPGACTYAVDPTSDLLHWHGTVGEGLEVRVTTGARCAWTVAPGAPWIELLTPGAGSGSSVVRVRVTSYTLETTRSAPLMVRWPTDTAGQNVWLTQEGCRYAISVTNDAVPTSGGRRRVSVFGTPVTVTCATGCPWSVAAGASWIHIVGGPSRAGDDDLFYDVDANTTGAPRTATVTIAGFTLTVTQGS